MRGCQSNLRLFACFLDPERWTNIPLLVKILKLIINELSNVMEANAARQATPAEWNQGAPDPYSQETLNFHIVG
jgi:hypothetical protein